MPLKIKFQRWPGQKQVFSHEKYGWTHKSCGLMGRFGGGWRWKLGLLVGGKTVILDLIFGSIRISWDKKP